MENETVKRRRPGWPRILTAEQRKRNKTKHMLNKDWYCDICRNGKNYSLAGKFGHLKIKKHKKNECIKE